MKIKTLLPKWVCMLSLALSAVSCSVEPAETPTLKDAYADKFYIGTALSATQIKGADSASIKVVKENFSSVTAENIMKSALIQPEEGEFNFAVADRFVDFGEENDMFILGHTLIWHSQAPSWFFVDNEGNDVSREILIERMKTHISTLAGRYKGRVNAWDVVNEAILDDGSFRNSKFYQIIGEDFIKYAFQFAHEADPDAELYYNDYSMNNEGKRNGVIEMVKKLQAEGVKIDGIGMQAHVGLERPEISELEASIEAFSALGVKVMITELDVSVLPFPGQIGGADISDRSQYEQRLNPYAEALPDSVETVFNQRYEDLFQLFLDHSDAITRVTLWGVNDGQSWKNDWPVPGRTDYPLLFDRDNHAKTIVEKLIDKVQLTEVE